jgi:hypothetical protein
VSVAPRSGRLSPGASLRPLNPSRSPRRPPPAARQPSTNHSQILLIHVVPGAFASSALREDIALPTALAGEVLNVDTPRGEVLLTPPAGGPARIVQADIRSAEGGFIDIIDTVLLPTAALGLALAPAPEGEAIFIAPAAEAAPALPAGPAAVVQPPVAIVPAGAAPAGQAPGGAATVPAGTPVVVQPTPP